MSRIGRQEPVGVSRASELIKFVKPHNLLYVSSGAMARSNLVTETKFVSSCWIVNSMVFWFLYDRLEFKPVKFNMPLMAQYELKLMHDRLRYSPKFQEVNFLLCQYTKRDIAWIKSPLRMLLKIFSSILHASRVLLVKLSSGADKVSTKNKPAIASAFGSDVAYPSATTSPKLVRPCAR